MDTELNATSQIKCIPIDARVDCPNPARWYVWIVGMGNTYTYSCDTHISERLKATPGVAQVRLIADGLGAPLREARKSVGSPWTSRP